MSSVYKTNFVSDVRIGTTFLLKDRSAFSETYTREEGGKYLNKLEFYLENEYGSQILEYNQESLL